MEKKTKTHKLLRDRWNGRSGYSVYFIPVGLGEVRDYISNSGIRLTPQCGDYIDYMKNVDPGQELNKESGTHNFTSKWEAPTHGCEVKIKKYSCS